VSGKGPSPAPGVAEGAAAGGEVVFWALTLDDERMDAPKRKTVEKDETMVGKERGER
jgi:hypothetical protein